MRLGYEPKPGEVGAAKSANPLIFGSGIANVCLAALRFEAAQKLHAHIPVTEKINLKDPAQIIIFGFVTGL